MDTDHLLVEKNRQRREAAARTTNHDERELRRWLLLEHFCKHVRERAQLTPEEINQET